MSENPFGEADDAAKAEDGQNPPTPDKLDSTPDKADEKRKSLIGLSPQQDAKIGTLKQMFQDHDEEVLCAILFEQNGGNLDASIETILSQQNITIKAKPIPEGEDADEDKSEETQESSLADKPAEVPKAGPSGETDKATQELIDEMLAEEQQQLYQAEQEEAKAEADELVERQQQQQLEQLMLQQDLENRRKQELARKQRRAQRAAAGAASDDSEESSDESSDLLDNFTEKFKDKFSGLFGSKAKKADPKELQRIANEEFLRENVNQQNKKKTFLQMLEDDDGVIEELTFTLPESVQQVQPISSLLSPEEQKAGEEKPTENKAIQVHSAKVSRAQEIRRVKEDYINVQMEEYGQESPGFENDNGMEQSVKNDLNQMGAAFNETMDDMRQSKDKVAQQFKQKQNAAKEKLKDMKLGEKGDAAKQKMKENSEAAAVQMKAVKDKMANKLKSFF